MIKEKIFNYEKARTQGITFKQFIKAFLTDKEEDLTPYNSSNITFDVFDKFESVIETIKECEKLCIIGDYDTDGVCASAIMYKGLKKLFPELEVITILPDRKDDGYGLKKPLVDKAINLGAEMLITVDNGINAIEAVKYAISKGLKVFLTDHHKPNDDTWKDVPWVINPMASENSLRNKEICGAYVALLVILKMIEITGTEVYEKLVKELKELASIATIGDSMPIEYENRALLKECMPRFLNGVAINKGLQLLMSSLNKFSVLEQDNLAFYLVPCINAGGRLESAQIAYDLFVKEDLKELVKLASKLVSLNNRRKVISNSIETYLKEQIDKESKMQIIQVPQNYNDFSDREIGGIIGIVASKVVEASKNPSLIFYGNRFSGRSMPDINLNDLLKTSKTPTFVFGGHAQACGGGLEFDKYSDSLRNELSNNISSLGDSIYYENYIKIPADMEPATILNAFEAVKPCNLNKIPKLFMENVKIEKKVNFGKHAQISFKMGGRLQTAMKFYDSLEEIEEGDIIEKLTFKVSPSSDGYAIIIEKIE